MLGIGGLQLVRAETPGPIKDSKLTPRIHETAKTLWVPAVNNFGGFGIWGFIEISDPWDAKNLIRSYLENFSLETIEGQ